MKHNNCAGWREIAGTRIFLRSKMEANYARFLQFLKDNKQIQDWTYEPKTFWFDAIKRGVRSYKPDFLIIENGGAEIYHETKGYMDAKSRTKIKRMGLYFPGVILKVVGKKHYREIERKLSKLIPGWE